MTDQTKEDVVVMARPPWWMDAVNKLGLPTAFLIGVSYMIWSAGRWSAQVIVVPLFERQIQFIEESRLVNQQMTKAVESIDRTLSAQGQHSIELLKANQIISEAIAENRKHLGDTREGIIVNQQFLERQEKSTEKVVKILESIDDTLKKP